MSFRPALLAILILLFAGATAAQPTSSNQAPRESRRMTLVDPLEYM